MNTIILRHKRALGDVVLVTALARDIQRAYPGQYRVGVDTGWAPVWDNNPDAYRVNFKTEERLNVIELNYGRGIAAAGKGEKIHFLTWFHRDFEAKTGLKVQVTEPKAKIVLSKEEQKRPVDGRYWVVMAGGKLDMTAKIWRHKWFQEVVDRLYARGLRFVQVGATHHGHVHPPLDNVLNAVGRTENPRELFSLIANSDGVLCGVTSAMHLAAAFDKPCVVVAGGREEPWWEHYADDYGAFGPVCAAVQMPHRFLHTVGVLDCCSYKGCWKNRTVPITPEDTISRKLKLCVDPVREEEQAVPRCMSLVTPDFVVDAVQSYYTSGAIAPYGVATRRFSLPHMEPRGVVRVQGPVKHVMFPDTEPDTHDGTVFTAPEHFNDRLGIDFTKEPSLVKPQKPEGATIPGERRQGVLDDVAYDHPFVGGIFTVCVLCYGHYPELARRCLEGVLRTVPAHRLDLRVGANECCAETLRYLRELPASKLYIYSHNHLKYPVMREMFHDERAPLSGKYVVWFDDDSYVVDDLWAVKLAKEIAANHTQGCRLYGMKFFHDIAPYAKDGHCPDQWFKSATWWRGKHLRVRNKQIAAANGSCIDFVAGGFWALCTKVIKEMHVPDVRLGLSGGDIVIGEQVRQGGHHLKNFNEHKKLVHSSGHDPRGLSPRTPKDKLFPWAPQ